MSEAGRVEVEETVGRMQKLVSRVRTMDRQQLETVFTSSAFMITAGLTFLNAIMLSNALGDVGRGAVAAAYGNTLVLGWAFQIGMPAAAAYFAKDIDRRRVVMSAWTMTLKVALPLALALTPMYLVMLNGKAFDGAPDSLKYWFLAFVAVNLLNSPYLSAIFWLRGVGNTVRFNALLALPQVLITTGYAVLFLSDTMTINRALTSTMIALTGGWIIALTITDAWPGRGYSKPVFDRVRNYSLRAWIGNLSFFVSLRVDLLILPIFVELDQVGHYAIAAAMATLSSPVARGAAQALLPFVRKAGSDAERISRVRQSTIWVSVASAATLLAIGLSASWLLPFLFSKDFSASVTPLLILLPGAFATDVTQVYSTALGSFVRPQDASFAQVLAAITTVVGLAALIPTLGIEGAAITTSVSYWVALLASIWFWRRLRIRVERGEVTGHTEQLEPHDSETAVT